MKWTALLLSACLMGAWGLLRFRSVAEAPKASAAPASERGEATPPETAPVAEVRVGAAERALVAAQALAQEPVVAEPRAQDSVAPAEVEPPAMEARAAPATEEPKDEAGLMARLEQLGLSDPAESIRLARLGDERYPNSPLAAQRGWVVAKSLVEQKRFPEAQEEARRLVAKYPGSPWAADVERHLLVYPLGQPSREQMQANGAR